MRMTAFVAVAEIMYSSPPSEASGVAMGVNILEKRKRWRKRRRGGYQPFVTPHTGQRLPSNPQLQS
jgi:hypothetical protein